MITPGDMLSTVRIELAEVTGVKRAPSHRASLAADSSPFPVYFPIAGQALVVRASIGVVPIGGAYVRAEDVLRDADVATYRAKAAGGGGYALFDPAMQAALAARVALGRDLRLALERAELHLAYQPIVDLATGRVATAEALVRWDHPAIGPVPPGAFIPVAEETGLSVPLGRWVLGEACRQARDWSSAGTPLAVAVNLTAREFQHPALVGEVDAALAEAGLDAQWLCLEITERLAMGDTGATVETLAALRARGVRTAIDDFGTGHSSLAYLKHLPLDAIKIDKAFVDGLGQGREEDAIAAAIVALGHTLGLRVVAEGVETAAQAAALRGLGCDLAQGYHFARPLPADALAALLAAGAALGEGASPA
jgi:EAL domain-containing protein (putative c-di-GMP-specific phosphodiesterase class I)